MDLIIKPTEKCNFKCTFCSSTKIANDTKDVLDHESIFRFLRRFPTKTIIVNGGDPLMLKPDYYWRIIDFLDANDMDTSLSITSNLWPFYHKPKTWAPLFNNDRVGVTTSFQYGGGRLKGDLTVFTEDDLWKVSDTMLEYCDYRPDFISVITKENQADAIRNVELAKQMSRGHEPKNTLHNLSKKKVGVECKLNYAMASGDQKDPYLLADIYKTYVEIYDKGLWPWEFNTRQMMVRLTGRATMCPQNRTCDEGIRVLQPSGDYYSCGAFGDDRQYPINFEQEMNGKFLPPLRSEWDIFSLKDECLNCPMFQICNGCKKTVSDMKAAGVVEHHCTKMKKLAPRIIEINNEAGND